MSFIYYATYSEGVRSGHLIKISHKGMLFKTWEGEISQGLSGSQIFSFSILDKDKQVIADLHDSGMGKGAVNYKLRDWLFSRQRFWGEPFPILHELDENGKPTGAVRAVPESHLPVDLPHIEDYKPHGKPEPPLGKADEHWLYPVIDGVKYRREINTMPQWAGSCWYYLRFIDPQNNACFIDKEKEKACGKT